MPDTTDKPKASEITLAEQPMTLQTLKKFIGTPTIPKRWKSVTDALAGVMYGKELGLAPMESLQQLHIINGSVGLSGKALSALIHHAGHMLIQVEMSTTRGAVKAMRRDPYTHALIDVGEFEFTWEDAEQAGLALQDTYQEYPKDMLYWRAVSRAAKVAFPDVTSGMLLPEEIGGEYVVVPAEDVAIAALETTLDAEVISEGDGYAEAG